MGKENIICPNCRQASAKPKPLFPFCSERCKTADLGAWAAEKYRVPVVDPEEALSALEAIDSLVDGEEKSFDSGED